MLSETQKTVLTAIKAGAPVKAALVKACPKGWVAKMREVQRTVLRKNSEVLLAKLGTLGFKVEKLDAEFNSETGELDAKVNKKGDEVIHVRMVKRAAAETVSREDALAAVKAGLTTEQAAMIDAVLAGKIVAAKAA